FGLVSVYGFDTEGLAARQLELYKAIGSHVVLECLSYVVGGDFNLEPPELRDTGWSWLGVKQVQRCGDSEFSPHFVVELEFYPALCRLQALGDFGRARRFLEWGEKALRSQDASEVRRLLSKAYQIWANETEGELCQRLEEELPCRGSRGKDPQVCWKAILQKDVKARRCPELRAMRWFCSRFRAAAQLLPAVWAGQASTFTRRTVGELLAGVLQSEWVPGQLSHQDNISLLQDIRDSLK
ncbi:unnamed protein product, partial [Prorocentrum cordatum]